MTFIQSCYKPLKDITYNFSIELQLCFIYDFKRVIYLGRT